MRCLLPLHLDALHLLKVGDRSGGADFFRQRHVRASSVLPAVCGLNGIDDQQAPLKATSTDNPSSTSTGPHETLWRSRTRVLGRCSQEGFPLSGNDTKDSSTPPMMIMLDLTTSPVRSICREARRYIREGHDPEDILRITRCETQVFEDRPLKIWAGLTVKEETNASIRFKKYRPFPNDPRPSAS